MNNDNSSKSIFKNTPPSGAGGLPLAYQKITFNHPQAARELLLMAGGVEEIYAHRADIREIAPDASEHFASLLNCDWSQYLSWAEKELAWCEEKNIKVLVMGNSDYPQRLVECVDAPVVLYYLGNADLNAPHILSIVGTRQATAYANDMIHRIISDMKTLVPDLVVFSGLAYGCDVIAHKEAITAGLPTVGVVAHGLDTLYPASHRNIAIKMLQNGGLLTEYTSHTKGDRQNFLRRNRIVAGISDCTIVAESMSHGGSLVTARIANDYGRDVFAFPGRIGDKASEGCNDLIRDNKAILLTSARDIITALGWHTTEEANQQRSAGIQLNLFPALSEDEQKIVTALQSGDQQQNIISMQTGIPISQVSALLFQMEMQGIVKPYAGGTYHLIH